MHTNTHGYIVKYITNEEVFIMDDGLEKLLKGYGHDRINAGASYNTDHFMYLATVVLT